MSLLKDFLDQTGIYIKTIIEFGTPYAKALVETIVPMIVSLFLFIVNIDYYKIVTHKAFITFIIFLVLLYLIYAFLSMYNPALLEKIIDFFRLKKKKTNQFKFLSSIDLSVESK
jgi:hypothetical protein